LSYIAVDIGATNIRVAIGNKDGLKKKVVEPTQIETGPKGIPEQIIRLIESIKIEKPHSIGIGSIGPIDQERGIIKNTPNYPFSNIPILEPLKEKYDIPIIIVNDCAAAVTGEHVFGEGKGLHNLVYVTLSTGIGGGVIVDNHLLLGKDGNAAEVGHFTIDPFSEMICGCGCIGHWEAFSSGMNIPKYAKSLLMGFDIDGSEFLNAIQNKHERLTSLDVFSAAKRGDKYANYVLERTGIINAIGFSNIVNAYDPELITIGGSIALNNPKMTLDPIHENIQKYTINRIPEIEITKLGQDIVLLGGLALGMKC
jgi:glucokinase